MWAYVGIPAGYRLETFVLRYRDIETLSVSLSFMTGIHWSSVDSLQEIVHKGPVSVRLVFCFVLFSMNRLLNKQTYCR